MRKNRNRGYQSRHVGRNDAIDYYVGTMGYVKANNPQKGVSAGTLLHHSTTPSLHYSVFLSIVGKLNPPTGGIKKSVNGDHFSFMCV